MEIKEKKEAKIELGPGSTLNLKADVSLNLKVTTPTSEVIIDSDKDSDDDIDIGDSVSDGKTDDKEKDDETDGDDEADDSDSEQKVAPLCKSMLVVVATRERLMVDSSTNHSLVNKACSSSFSMLMIFFLIS